MFKLVASTEYAKWFKKLRDGTIRGRIAARLNLVTRGHFGDTKSVGDGVSELRFHFGPGYRVYITQRGSSVVILLCAGDKSTQTNDIAKAKEIAADYEE